MANFNRVVMIGRCCRDPETKEFGNGGKVTKAGFVVNNRKKVKDAWVDDPCFVDIEAFNRGDYGTIATQIEEKVRKGASLLIEGKLILEQWDDKSTGAKRSKHKIVVEAIQLLDRREDTGEGDRPSTVAKQASNGRQDDDGESGGEIPF